MRTTGLMFDPPYSTREGLVVPGRIESDGHVSILVFVDEEDAAYQDPVWIELCTQGFDKDIARVKLRGLTFRVWVSRPLLLEDFSR